MLQAVYRRIIPLVEILAIVGISLVVVFTAYEVTVREIFSRPTIWTNEITSYLLVWMGLLSIVYAFDQKSHVSVDLVYRHLGRKMQQWADLVTHSLMLVFVVLLCGYGYKYWWLAYSRDWRHFGMLDVPMSYTRIALPLAGFLMVMQIALTLYAQLIAMRRGPEPKNGF